MAQVILEKERKENPSKRVIKCMLLQAISHIIIYKKILLDCDWLVSVHLIPNSSAKICNNSAKICKKLNYLIGGKTL
jgi:hypothetical protein